MATAAPVHDHQKSSQMETSKVQAAQVAEDRHGRIAAIMSDYCPADQKDRPLVEKMGATILALFDAMKK